MTTKTEQRWFYRCLMCLPVGKNANTAVFPGRCSVCHRPTTCVISRTVTVKATEDDK